MVCLTVCLSRSQVQGYFFKAFISFFFFKLLDLKENFNCDKDEIIRILKEIQQKIYDDTKKNITRNLRDISSKIIEQFKKKFCSW